MGYAEMARFELTNCPDKGRISWVHMMKTGFTM